MERCYRTASGSERIKHSTVDNQINPFLFRVAFCIRSLPLAVL